MGLGVFGFIYLLSGRTALWPFWLVRARLAAVTVGHINMLPPHLLRACLSFRTLLPAAVPLFRCPFIPCPDNFSMSEICAPPA